MEIDVDQQNAFISARNQSTKNLNDQTTKSKETPFVPIKARVFTAKSMFRKNKTLALRSAFSKTSGLKSRNTDTKSSTVSNQLRSKRENLNDKIEKIEQSKN